MKTIILVSMVLGSSLAFAGSPSCEVLENGKLQQTISDLEYSGPLVDEAKSILWVSYNDQKFNLCVFSTVSPNGVVVCTTGESANLNYNGKAINCENK